MSELQGMMAWMPALLTGALVAFIGLVLRSWVQSVDRRLHSIEGQLATLARLDKTTAVADTRLAEHGRRIDRLERGALQ